MLKDKLLTARVGASSCGLCALKTCCYGAFLKMLGMDSAAGLRHCKVGHHTSIHGSEECETAASLPRLSLHLCLQVHRLLHQIAEQMAARTPRVVQGRGQRPASRNIRSRVGLSKSSLACGGSQCPKLPSWQKISLGASPVITCTDARAETWAWKSFLSKAMVLLVG